MAKTPTRRAYEYDHHYGLALGGKTGSKAGRSRAGSAATSSRPAKARSTKRSAKKR